MCKQQGNQGKEEHGTKSTNRSAELIVKGLHYFVTEELFRSQICNTASIQPQRFNTTEFRIFDFLVFIIICEIIFETYFDQG
jgi:hypothetical protein